MFYLAEETALVLLSLVLRLWLAAWHHILYSGLFAVLRKCLSIAKENSTVKALKLSWMLSSTIPQRVLWAAKAK